MQCRRRQCDSREETAGLARCSVVHRAFTGGGSRASGWITCVGPRIDSTPQIGNLRSASGAPEAVRGGGLPCISEHGRAGSIVADLRGANEGAAADKVRPGCWLGRFGGPGPPSSRPEQFSRGAPTSSPPHARCLIPEVDGADRGGVAGAVGTPLWAVGRAGGGGVGMGQSRWSSPAVRVERHGNGEAAGGPRSGGLWTWAAW